MKNKIIIGLIVLIVIFVGFIFYYKIFKINSVKELYKDTIINIKEFKKMEDDDLSLILENNVIRTDVKEIEYKILGLEKAIYGKLYINNGGVLVLTNDAYHESSVISSIKFKTLMSDAEDILSAYAISEDGELYHILLYSYDINNVNINKKYMDKKIMYFTDMYLEEYESSFSDDCKLVLADNDKLYDMYTGLRYKNGTMLVYRKYMVFADGTMTNLKYKKLVDNNGVDFKLKTIISVYDDKIDIEGIEDVILITTTNEIIYLKDEEKLVVYGKKVSKIKEEDTNIVITFEDNSSIKFKGEYNKALYPIQ